MAPPTSSPEPAWLEHYRAGREHGVRPAHDDLLAAFRAIVHRHPDRPAILYFDGALTFGDLDVRSDALAAHLHRLGFAPGARLALYLQNSPAFVVGVLAAWKAGGVALVMNPMYRRREVEYLLADSGAEIIICLDDEYEIARGILADGTTGLRHVLVVSARDDQTRDDPRVLPAIAEAAGTTRLRAIPAGARTSSPAHPRPDDLALLMYTSGTTGQPKGAEISHRGLAFSSEVYRTWVGLDVTDRILAVAPLFHITGFVGHVAASLVSGAALVLHHRFEGGVVLDALREHRPTFTVGAVTVFNNLAHHPDAHRDDFASLRVVLSGGSPIAPALSDEIHSLTGMRLHNLYGMTETTGPAIGVPVGTSAPVDPTSGALSIGLPVYDTHVRIADDEGRDVPAGEIGELRVSGPQVIREYWNRPDDTAERIMGDEIATGDVGFVDDDGWCFLVDRKSDVINASGYKVWPREVEDVLYAHPAVREAAVVGVVDSYRGETVKAFVVLEPGATIAAADLEAHCRAQLAAYKVPRAVEFCDGLPTSVTGKILRRELRER